MFPRGHGRDRWASLIAATLALAALTTARPSSAQEPARGTIVDRRGRTLATTRGGERVYPRGPVAGHLLAGVERTMGPDDMVLTIDLDLQKVAHGALMKHRAAAVAVVEVETGRILALVSAPEGDPRQVDVDRAVGRAYPPASTFKLITAVAGLETGAVSPEHEETCTGHRVVGSSNLLDMGVHGTLDFVEALQHSCNVYFFSVGERVGVARLGAFARDFGFGEPSGLGINGDAAGHVPDAAEYGGHSERDQVLRLRTAIGAASVRATVLQVAMAYAALANGGRLYRPQIVRRVRRPGGEVLEEREPVLRRHVSASAATLEVIRRGLYRAVNRRGGTAFAAKKGVVKMVGKTGTAPLPTDPEESHAWFAGWAPADHPKMAIAVMIENGGIGGAVAAPVARDIIDAYYIHAARERRAELRQAKAAKARKAAKAKAKAAKAARRKGKQKAQARTRRGRRR